MIHYNSLSGIKLNRCILTIGAFDGIHLGHQELLNSVVKYSNSANLESVVLTFNPIPFIFFRKHSEPYNLLDISKKSKLLESIGIDHVITLAFNKQLSGLSPEVFMDSVLKSIDIDKLVIGYDFTLGKDKTGTFSVLDSIGKKRGFDVIVVPPLKVNKNIVSSSLIRNVLKEGFVRETAMYLGRNYSIDGIVVTGDGMGKSIGFPTANVNYDITRLLPKNGVYITLAKIDDDTYPSVTNIGLRPTISNDLNFPRIETHILNFDKHIYQQQINIEFIDFIREEVKFSSINELKSQINQDVNFTKKVLSDGSKTTNISSRSKEN